MELTSLLSSIEIRAVCSDQFYQLDAPYECEEVSGLGGTYADHGGAWMQIVTEELGERSWGFATLDGAPVQEIYSVPIVNQDRTVIGYRRWWLADGFQGGQFIYRAGSIHSAGERYDWLTVR